MTFGFIRDFIAVCQIILLGSTPAFAGIDESQFSSSDVITRDVTIIGGGSSGTYAAIRLRQLGHSVSVVEQKDTLGGHVNTFFDPVTGESFDYGVISFFNITVVRNYFASLNVPLAPLSYSSGGVTQYFNFLDASPVSAASVSTGNVTEALIGYLAQLDKYPDLFPNGYQLPDPVPEDLLIPFGDFLDKYDLQGLAYTAFMFIQGVGNILKQPTLYVMKYFAPATATAILSNTPAFLTTANNDNHGLYVAAENELGSDAHLSSNVTSIERQGDTVYTVISTPSGSKLLKSSWLLIAIQPKLSNLSPFLDLDSTESSLLAQFNNSYYWDGVVQNTGIPNNTSLANVDLSAALQIPAMPALYGIESTGVRDLHSLYFSSPYYIPDSEVESQILTTIAELGKAAGYPPPANGTVELVALNSHAPFECAVSVDAIKDGFYEKLNGLQGSRRTWWTGATWEAHDSSQIWNWTEYYLLPKIRAVL